MNVSGGKVLLPNGSFPWTIPSSVAPGDYKIAALLIDTKGKITGITGKPIATDLSDAVYKIAAR